MSTNLADIKVGDRVWVGGGFASDKRIETVIHATPARLALDRMDRLFWRTGNRVGYRVGVGTPGHIIGLATPEECEAWDKAREEKRQTEAKRAEERAYQQSLESLFDPAHAPSVSRAYNHFIDGKPVEWCLILYGSESDVRRWAELLKGKKS